MNAIGTSTLEEVCALVTDGTHDTPKRTVVGFSLVKAKEIVGGIIDFENCDKISRKEHERVIARSKPEYGDTLFAHIGASLGEAAYVKTHEPFSIKNIALFKPNPEKIDGRYLYYLTISPRFQALAKNRKTGSAQPFLSLGHLRGHQIRYHMNLEVQTKIASILSAYDDLIENNLRRIKILEEMAQNLYREWFVNFRFTGHENVRMVDSELGKVPEGWEPTTLGDVAEQVRRNVKPEEIAEATPYVGLEHIPRESIALTSWGFADDVKSTKLRFEENEILFGKIRPYFHKVVFAPIEGVCSSDAIVIRPKTNDMFATVLTCTSSKTFVDQATQTSQGTKMPRANWDILVQFPLPTPPPDVLNRFNEMVENSVDLIRNLIFRNQCLGATRDLLLPDLMSGELDVSDLDIEVPEAAA